MATTDHRDFDGFFAAAKPRLRRALVATYGPDRGRETTASPSLDLLATTRAGTVVRISLSSGLDSSLARAILHSLRATS